MLNRIWCVSTAIGCGQLTPWSPDKPFFGKKLMPSFHFFSCRFLILTNFPAVWGNNRAIGSPDDRSTRLRCRNNPDSPLCAECFESDAINPEFYLLHYAWFCPLLPPTRNLTVNGHDHGISIGRPHEWKLFLTRKREKQFFSVFRGLKPIFTSWKFISLQY